METADVTREADLQRVVDHIRSDRPPLRGVLHAAGTLDDGLLPDQTPAQFRAVLAPKVTGSWLLHQLTRELELDYLVFFSSVAAFNGGPGQASYAAASAFQDALAHYRRSQGLPALSVNWGGWREIGMAADYFAGRTGQLGISPTRGIAALNLLLARGAGPQVAVTPVPVPVWLGEHIARSPFFSRIAVPRGERERGVLGARLRAVDPDAQQAMLESFLIDQVAAVLRIPAAGIAADVALNQYGLTSLLALELRNRVEAALGLAIPVVQFYKYRTLRAFATRQLERLALAALVETDHTRVDHHNDKADDQDDDNNNNNDDNQDTGDWDELIL